MKTAEFDYHLPAELIAQVPVEPRDAARLMVVDRQHGNIVHRHFRDLPEYLRPGDVLVFNESRVIPARLFARKPTGGQVELLLLRPRREETWEVLARGRGLRAGLTLTLLDGPQGKPVPATAEIVGRSSSDPHAPYLVTFSTPALPLAEQIGRTPLPPYIRTPLANPERYQTVYARSPGSVAAPTAGLHFTPELLDHLREMGVHFAFVTLHVGLDTFQPVKEEEIEAHRMHREYCSLPASAAEEINSARRSGGRIVAVGTTSVRVLETAAIQAERLFVSDVVVPFEGFTDLYIYPGYQFRVVDALVTNFHLPRSTLLMLVAAFAGKTLIDHAYAVAIEERYRFYSFGDAMLIL